MLKGNKLTKEVFPHVEFHQADVRDSDKMKILSKDCQYIFHFAAVLGVDVVADNPVETMETEVIGTKNICDAAYANGISKILYASTSGVYGHSALSHTVTEDLLVDPKTSYAMAKRYNEIYLGAHFQEKGLNSVSFRFFNIYGPRQDNRMVIPRFIEQAMNNEPITVYGQGKQTRDFTYVDDAVKACLLLMDNVKGSEIYNIANEKEIQIEEVANTIKDLTKSKSVLQFVEAPSKRYDYEVGRRWGSSEKLFQTVGFKPSISLIDGLKKIL
jgi:UDP-glucose 4-epimerase